MKIRLSESKYVGRDDDGTWRLTTSVGPIADVHAHLALTYVGSGQIDLMAEAVGQIYLDPEAPLDLDLYMNQNFDDASMKEMRKDLSVRSLAKKGRRATHTAPALNRSMRGLGIEASVILAIDLPHSTHNTDSYLTVAAQTDTLVPAAAIHPYSPNAEALLRSASARGARAFKMHPAVQQMRPDHPKAMRLYEVCGELDMPVVWHCGPVGIVNARADERCRIKHYWGPIHDLPGTRFVLGHTGALQYRQAVKLPNMYDNVYVEVACQGLPALRHILDVVPRERVLNGSDWPFYHQGVSILKLLHATEEDEDLRHRVLWKNAADLFGLESVHA